MSKEKVPTKVFLKKAVLITTLCLTPFFIFFQNYQFMVAPGDEEYCLPWKYYLMESVDSTKLEKGEYIAFETDKRMDKFFAEHTRFTKMVVAVEGDTVNVKEGGLYVNGKFEKALSKKVLAILKTAPKELVHNYTLKEGEYWGVGTHPDSYDSTYWGAIKPQQIIGKIYPLI